MAAKKKRVSKTKKRPTKRVAPWSGFRLKSPRGGYFTNVTGWNPDCNAATPYDGDHRWGEYEEDELRGSP